MGLEYHTDRGFERDLKRVSQETRKEALDASGHGRVCRGLKVLSTIVSMEFDEVVLDPEKFAKCRDSLVLGNTVQVE